MVSIKKLARWFADNRLLQATALRNYETLSQNTLSTVPPEYHFVGSAEASKYGDIVRDDATKEAKIAREIHYLGFRELDRQGREDRERREARFLRIFMALFGVTALIAPMHIMALHQALRVSLITTSVATVAFGIFIALWANDSSGKDVLAATAAYTAVLVVFVGTSLAIPSQ
jgi:VIT1/CCC1 family predicted Fe2+/Mn2+ transporter